MNASVRTAAIMGLFFVVAQLGALAMVSTFLGPEWRAFENPNDPMIPVYYIIAILAFTFGVLHTIRKKKDKAVKAVLLAAVVYTVFFVVMIFFARFVGGLLPIPLSAGVTAVLAYYLVKRPEWYVVDAVGMLMSIGIIGIFGISLGILPVLVLLVALAIYDAVSVYGTKHMVSLADGVTRLRLPILLVIPKKRGYSFLRQRPLLEQLDEGDEREAMFMGLGDVIIPGVLVASAFSFLPEDPVGGVSGNLLVALGTLAGALVGFAVLMRYVLRGNPQAGLPLLNGGALAGYLVSYLVVFRELSFGIAPFW